MDFSLPENKKLFEREVQVRMGPPFYLPREQAEMLVAALLTDFNPVLKENK